MAVLVFKFIIFNLNGKENASFISIRSDQLVSVAS